MFLFGFDMFHTQFALVVVFTTPTTALLKVICMAIEQHFKNYERMNLKFFTFLI